MILYGKSYTICWYTPLPVALIHGPCSGVSNEFRSSYWITLRNPFKLFRSSVQWGQDSLISFLMSVVFWQYSIQCNMSMVVRPKMPITYIIRFSCFCSSDIPYFTHITGLIREAQNHKSSYSTISYGFMCLPISVRKYFIKMWNYCGGVASQNTSQSHMFSHIT